jgi:hypothetical protein
MQTLKLEPGDLLQVKSTDLPLGTFIKLQPQDPSFLEISDPKAVLENAFRNFSCLTKGDIFTFAYNDNVYSIAVLEAKPEHASNAICTLETDLSVDFAPPVGYQEHHEVERASWQAKAEHYTRKDPWHKLSTTPPSPRRQPLRLRARKPLRLTSCPKATSSRKRVVRLPPRKLPRLSLDSHRIRHELCGAQMARSH